MEARRVPIDAIFLGLSVLSLLYIRYYEQNYHLILSAFPMLAYENIAIPSFYFFLTGGVTMNLANMAKLGLPPVFCKIMRYVVVIALLAYAVLVGLKAAGTALLPTISFCSVWSGIFSLLGLLFALAPRQKIHKEGEA